MSVEAMVLDPRYEELFTEEERRIARRRLADLDYYPQEAERFAEMEDGE